MYDTSLTRQSLPSEQYRLLLGTAVCVFSSNNAFVIENILRVDDSASWFELIDKTAGAVKSVADGKLPEEIISLFTDIIKMRNRIIHGFQITTSRGEQSIATKDKRGCQFEITEEYLKEFIRKNEKLSSQLHAFRGF